MRRPIIDLRSFTTWADRLDHPECVAVGPDGRLYAGGEAGQVYRLDPEGPIQIATTGGFVLGLALDADSFVYACDQVRHEVVRVDPAGPVEPYSGRIGIPNYPVFDAAGTLFVSDSGSWDGHDGSLHRVAVGGATQQLDIDGVASFPNGLCLSPDGEWLYVVLSQVPGIARVPLRGGWPAGDAELVLSLPDHVPDGIAALENGDLVIACYAPDVLYVFDIRSAALRVLATDPRRVVLAAPTNVAFFGEQRDRLAVGSLGRWHVATAATPLRGAALRYPRVVETH